MNHNDNDAALAHQQQLENEQMNKLSAALVRAQRAFSPALKTSVNPHFKNRYAALDACIDAVMDALNNEGIFLMQRTYNDEAGVAVETVFVHESGEELSGGILRVPAVKQDPQGYGSALTYCRRYSLMTACGIAGEDDDGEAARKTPKAPAFDLQKAISLMEVCETVEELKTVFSYWYRSTPNALQREALKNSYDEFKLHLTTTEKE
jgi:hypothetical protein